MRKTARMIPVRWRDSLFVRVVALCGVLVLCLLGYVIVISSHYFSEAVMEMEAHADEIAGRIELMLRDNPDMDNDTLTSEIMRLYNDEDIELRVDAGAPAAPAYHLERREGGQWTRVTEVPIDVKTRNLVLTLRATTDAQIEVLRAFKNRYFLMLSAVFLLTLGLMIYFIGKALRPLTRLSETCAAISKGELRSVNTRGAAGEVLALERTFNDMVESLREKELMEAKLRQAQRLSALGNLAAGVAHDVRNPLNAIKLLSSHALDKLPNGPESEASKPLRTIRTEVGRLEEIVSSFLSLARESELRPEPMPVDTLLEDCIHLLRKDAEAREVRLAMELRAGDTQLLLDPKQWRRAVLNVLMNALEACPPGGRVRLFSRLTDTDCELEIRDDGPGLPRAELERVFDPYYTTKPGGTGLGLSLTRGIVEEHGGTIELTSVEGQGCQVLIRMPLATTKAP